jgi:hypothetical protein
MQPCCSVLAQTPGRWICTFLAGSKLCVCPLARSPGRERIAAASRGYSRGLPGSHRGQFRRLDLDMSWFAYSVSPIVSSPDFSIHTFTRNTRGPRDLPILTST